MGRLPMPRTSNAGAHADVGMPRPQKPRRAPAASNGHAQVEEPALELQMLLDALQSVRIGDFSVRLPRDRVGLAGKIADTFNEIVAANERMAQQLEEVGQVVGREGKTKKRVRFGLNLGAW